METNKQPTILDGTKPLWPSIVHYLNWIDQTKDELYERYEAGDKDAAFVVDASIVLGECPEYEKAKARAIVMLATEYYIAKNYPHIAIMNVPGWMD
jgi:hypothetical protein